MNGIMNYVICVIEEVLYCMFMKGFVRFRVRNAMKKSGSIANHLTSVNDNFLAYLEKVQISEYSDTMGISMTA